MVVTIISPRCPRLAGRPVAGACPRPLRLVADLNGKSSQILLVGLLEELPGILGERPVLEHAMPGHESTGPTWLGRNREVIVRQVEVPDPDHHILHDLEDLSLVWILFSVRTMHREQPGTTGPGTRRRETCS
jgi:hypothetical protein